jgi:hypothetical protein
MARTKQTARLTTGSHPAPRVGAAATGRVIGHRIAASSSDPPVASYQLGDSIYALVAKHAEEDLAREARYRYEDIVEPFLTSMVSRSARTNIINAFKQQIRAEQGTKAPEESKDSGNPMPDSDPESEEEEHTNPDPVPQPKRKHAAVANQIFTMNKKSKGGVSFIKPRAKKTKAGSSIIQAGYWVATYKNYRKCGFTTKESAEAKLKQWKDQDLCPLCERPMPI